MAELDHIYERIGNAREGWSFQNPETSRMYPMVKSIELELLVICERLVEEIERLQERVADLEDSKRWVSNAGAVERT